MDDMKLLLTCQPGRAVRTEDIESDVVTLLATGGVSRLVRSHKCLGRVQCEAIWSGVLAGYCRRVC
jgi:hypothetical protein